MPGVVVVRDRHVRDPDEHPLRQLAAPPVDEPQLAQLLGPLQLVGPVRRRADVTQQGPAGIRIAGHRDHHEVAVRPGQIHRRHTEPGPVDHALRHRVQRLGQLQAGMHSFGDDVQGPERRQLGLVRQVRPGGGHAGTPRVKARHDSPPLHAVGDTYYDRLLPVTAVAESATSSLFRARRAPPTPPSLPQYARGLTVNPAAGTGICAAHCPSRWPTPQVCPHRGHFNLADHRPLARLRSLCVCTRSALIFGTAAAGRRTAPLRRPSSSANVA